MHNFGILDIKTCIYLLDFDLYCTYANIIHSKQMTWLTFLGRQHYGVFPLKPNSWTTRTLTISLGFWGYKKKNMRVSNYYATVGWWSWQIMLHASSFFILVLSFEILYTILICISSSWWPLRSVMYVFV